MPLWCSPDYHLALSSEKQRKAKTRVQTVGEEKALT